MADFDAIVVGSGFGGSVSALRLAEKGYAAARLSGRSSSVWPHVAQTARATSNGTPPRCTITCEVTALCR